MKGYQKIITNKLPKNPNNEELKQYEFLLKHQSIHTYFKEYNMYYDNHRNYNDINMKYYQTIHNIVLNYYNNIEKLKQLSMDSKSIHLIHQNIMNYYEKYIEILNQSQKEIQSSNITSTYHL